MQSAHRRRHITETALVKVQNEILLAMDNGLAFDTVSLYFNKSLREKRIALDW